MTRSQILLSLGLLLGSLIAPVIAPDASAATSRVVDFDELDLVPARGQDGGNFDRGAAAHALSSVDLNKCKAPTAKRGEGHVTVKFVPDGNVSEANVDRGPLVGTPVAKCVASQYKKVKVPAFKGQPVQVGKSFHFD